MSVPPDPLRTPPWSHRVEVWRQLTSGATLFTHLAALLRQASPAHGLLDVASWWKASHVDRLPEGTARVTAQRRWEVLGRMLWCFKQSAALRSSDLHDTDRLLEMLRQELPAFSARGIEPRRLDEGRTARREAEEAWAYMCMRSLLGVQPLRRVIVPVALCDPERGDEGGFVATLELELLSGGARQLAPHPAAAFEIICHDEFDLSMNRAWRAAAAAVRLERPCDGRWRLRRGAPFSEPASPIELEAVDGASASGAALRGWWYALKGRVPDEGVVVLAQVVDGRSSCLQTVGGIRAKVAAIAREGRAPDGLAFDTVFVVGEENRMEARDALDRGADRQPQLAILNIS